VAKEAPDEPFMGPEMRPRLESPSVTHDAKGGTQDLFTQDGRVRGRQAVASYEQSPALVCHHRHDTVREESALPAKQEDVAADDLLHAASSDKQHIARPYRRQHASTRDAQADCARNGEHFGDEGAPGGMCAAKGCPSEKAHELFKLNRHCPSTGMTLPQERADVSKTRSDRKDGFR
jgi:hypothetical protein